MKSLIYLYFEIDEEARKKQMNSKQFTYGCFSYDGNGNYHYEISCFNANQPLQPTWSENKKLKAAKGIKRKMTN